MNNDIENYKEFLISRILLRDIEEYTKEDKEKLQFLRRDKVDDIVISVEYTSSSIIGGIEELFLAIEEYLEKDSKNYELIKMGSLGLCSKDPMIGIQLPGKTNLILQNINLENFQTVFEGVFSKHINLEYIFGQFRNDLLEPWEGITFIDEIAFFANQQRVILNNCGKINPESIDEYIANGGYKSFVKVMNNYTRDEVAEIIEKSKLKGRGGEGFLTGKKWKIAINTDSNNKYLICNAGEGDPGAFSERFIMESDPHKLIEGIAIALYGIGAKKAYIYVDTENKLAIERLTIAINSAKEYGLLGHDVFQSGNSFDIVIRKGAGAYVCGEETALIKFLEGERGMPINKPPYPATKGLFGAPTVVNNSETLINLPKIFEKGPKWYRAIGIDSSKGTKVFSLAGKVENCGIIEVEFGTKLREIIFRVGGGVLNGKKFKGLHIGGPTGRVVAEQHLDEIIDFENENIGENLDGGIIVLDEDTCVIDTVKYFADFLKNQSCGKCIPCREGTRRISEILENITKKPVDNDNHTTLYRFKGVMQLENLAEVIKETSLCGLGKRAANPVLSSLKWFREEYEEHIFDRECKAGVCQELRTFIIDVEACIGCTICAKKCPTGAIIGTQKAPHFIVQDNCIGCGICYKSCKFNAILSM